MTLLDRLVLKDLVPRLLMSIAVFSTVFFATGPLLAAARFISQGIPPWVVLQFMGWNLTYFVSWTFPIGVLVASLLGFDRLSRESEAVALFAAGIPFLRIAAPAIALSLLVSGVGYVFNDRVASYANQRVDDIKNRRQNLFGETTRSLHFEDRAGGVLKMTVQVEKGYDLQAKALRQVTITLYDGSGRQPTDVIYADRARWAGGTRWHLTGTAWHPLLGPSGAMSPSLTNDELRVFDLHQQPESVSLLTRDPETLDFHDLRRQIAALEANGAPAADVRDAQMNLWNKIALPFSCLVFGTVGAPLGLRPQRSSQAIPGMIWALPIILAYYVMYTAMSSVAKGGYVAPSLAAFLPDILGVILGAYLTWRAST